jgi:hypothetical protein
MESETDVSMARAAPLGRRPQQGGITAVLIPLNLLRDQPLQQQLYDQL